MNMAVICSPRQARKPWLAYNNPNDRHATPFHLCYLHFLVSPTPTMPCHMVSMTTPKIYTSFTVTRIFSHSNLHPTCNGEKSNYTLNFICENLSLTVKKEIFDGPKIPVARWEINVNGHQLLYTLQVPTATDTVPTCMRQKDKSDT
jgi:hypothetical protein